MRQKTPEEVEDAQFQDLRRGILERHATTKYIDGVIADKSKQLHELKQSQRQIAKKMQKKRRELKELQRAKIHVEQRDRKRLRTKQSVPVAIADDSSDEVEVDPADEEAMLALVGVGAADMPIPKDVLEMSSRRPEYRHARYELEAAMKSHGKKLPASRNVRTFVNRMVLKLRAQAQAAASSA